MKKIKNMFKSIFTFILLFVGMTVVNAATGTLALDGASEVELNKNIDITIAIKGLSDSTTGVGSLGGQIIYNNEYLNYVDCESLNISTDYAADSDHSGMVAGLAFNAKQAAKGVDVNFIKLTFKAVKEGNTTITFKDGEVTLLGQGSPVTTTDPTKTIKIGPVKNGDATLRSLSISNSLSLSPAFSSGTTSYTVNVPEDVPKVTVSGEVNNSKSSATGFGDYSITGNKTVSIVVTAENGSKKTYTINFKKETNGDATLKSLAVNNGLTLSPEFNSATTSYTVNVPTSVSRVNVSGAVNNSKSRVTGLGDYTVSADLSVPVVVTAENGTKKTYTINFKKETPAPRSNDATLKGLEVSGYDIGPAFTSGVTEYNVTVPHGADSVIVNATPNDTKARVEVSGDKDLKIGDNKVTVKVTAEDGTVKTYTINVKKEDKPDTTFKGDATLKSLEVVDHTLSPEFKSDSHSYVVNVKSDVDSVKINAVATDPKGVVSITGNTNLKEGVNTVIVRVTNEDGKTSDYVVNVVKEKKEAPKPSSPSKSSDSYLKNLTINSAHTLDKVFDKNIQGYAVTVPYEVEKLDLKYVKNNSKAKVTITGNENFKVGVVNTVTITVTAEDGSTRLYLLNVIRSPEVSGTDLEKLVVNGKDIYKPNQTKYDVTVDGKTDKLDISAIPVDKDSKVEIIGNENLKEGKNTVWVKVTDKKGYEKLYEITVTKEAVKKSSGFLGLSGKTWGIILGTLGFLLILFLLLLLLFRRRKDEGRAPIVVSKDVPPAPVIEFKPEFNFGSKNSSDDDVVHGNMNQESQLTYKGEEDAPKRLIDAEVRDAEEVPYDPFDETITKDEIVDAIHEAMQTKDTSKLRMLLDQDELNQRKKDIKRKEKSRRSYDDDYF